MARESANTAYPHTGSYSEPTYSIFGYHYSGGKRPRFLDPHIDTECEGPQAATAVDACSGDIGGVIDFCFHIYCNIPCSECRPSSPSTRRLPRTGKPNANFGVHDFEYVEAA